MNILLTNDDGIHAEGLGALYERFSGRHCLSVVAPDRNQSAVSHGITLYHPLRIRNVSVHGGEGYAVTGTPADCVKLAFCEILDTAPDMVISGINCGSNVGSSVNYSGTVAAAREGALYGVAAMAVSIQGHEGAHYADAARFSELLAERVFEKGLPRGTFLNVNIPDMPMRELAGIRITQQEVGRQSEYFERRDDPRDLAYYWLGSDIRKFDEEPDKYDGAALFRNHVSITPLTCDMTNHALVEAIKEWDVKL